MRASVAIMALCAVPCVLGLAWLGCATANDEVETVPKGTRDSGVDPSGDSGGGTDTDITKPDTAPPPPLCAETGVPNGCAAAVDLGTLAPGDKKSASNAVPPAGGEFWFKVTFSKLDDLTAHPHIKLTAKDTGIAASVLKTCGGESFSCGDEDAMPSTALKDFEVSYRLIDPSADAGPDPTADAFVPISEIIPATVYIKVTRSAGTPTSCDFTIDVSN